MSHFYPNYFFGSLEIKSGKPGVVAYTYNPALERMRQEDHQNFEVNWPIE